MNILDTLLKIRVAGRLCKILWLVIGTGWKALRDTAAAPALLRSLLERLGPTFIKLGQVLSLRADLVGEKISRELSKLQNEAPPFPYEEAREIIREELGEYPENIYGSFEARPVAAASLSQVHRATMPDGTVVAVKVQRPGIKGVIEMDIDILFCFARCAERFVPALRAYKPVKVVREFADWTMRELDFTIEGHNADRFRFLLGNDARINIPTIFWQMTAPRVLTMDFVHGIKADDLSGMESLKVDRKEIAMAGIEAMFRQFYIDGFFHADPHPGNFFVLEDGRLCLHDFGMVGYLDERTRKELVSCLLAFSNKDYEGFLRHFLVLAVLDEESDIAGFSKDISVILSELFFSTKPLSMAAAFFRIINKGARHGIGFSADLALYGKAIITTEAMGLKIYPEFDFNTELEPFVRKAFLGYAAIKLRSMRSDIFDYLDFSTRLPLHAQKLVEQIEKGEVTVRIDTAEFLRVKDELNRQNNARILGTLAVAVFLGTMALLHLEGRTTLLGISLSNLGLGLFAALFIWFLFKLRKKG